LSDAGLEAVLTRATGQLDAWRAISLRIPDAAQTPVVVTVDHGQPGQPHLRETLTFDRATGDPVRRETFADASAGRRARMVLRFAWRCAASPPGAGAARSLNATRPEQQ
jgi:hypothetical protein